MVNFFFFLIISFISFNNLKQNNQIQLNEKVISIFRGSGNYKDYKLIIDKKYYYSDKNKTIQNGAFGELITKYKTKNNVVKIYLKIDGKDTAFNYNVSKYDSLMMGHGYRNFYVFNEEEYVWAND